MNKNFSYKKSISKNILLIIFIIIIETLLIKLFMYDTLPQKYFSDANHILNVMNNVGLTDKAYTYTANIFNFFNLFGFSTIEEWGYLISVIFLPILIFEIAKKKKYNNFQLIFIISSIALLNIYVFGLSKDVIQFVYFLAIFFVLKSNKLSNLKKIISICIILLYEALNFRVYYAIMAMLVVTIYYIYLIFIDGRKISKKTFKKIILIAFFAFFLETFVVQLISSENYESILNARYSVNIFRQDGTDSNTLINDLLGRNTNYFIFMGNYFINAIRLMFPIELFLKGPKQGIFVIYQIFVSFCLIKACRKINKENCLWIITVISFFMISFIFEPDFGSFVRHETTMFLILLEVINISYEKSKNNLIEKNKLGGEEDEKKIVNYCSYI